MINQGLLFLAAVLASLLLTFPVAWILETFRLTQFIREEGPEAHRQKAGTPTMGGIPLVIAAIALAIVFIDLDLDPKYIALILLIFGYAAIGFSDDLIKIVRKRNEGLTFRQKIIFQTFFAALFSAFIIACGHQETVGGWLKTAGFQLPIFYFLLSTFIIVGSANATNLTDGLNGLLAGTATIAFLSFAILANIMGVTQAATFSIISAGAICAFLYFNFPKAKLFMGDVGSLAIGAGLAGVAILLHRELRLAVIGGVFVVEALSVILQVTGYKLFKRRLFKMSPLHHHFELMGFKETSVVAAFWIIALLLGIVGVII